MYICALEKFIWFIPKNVMYKLLRCVHMRAYGGRAGESEKEIERARGELLEWQTHMYILYSSI